MTERLCWVSGFAACGAIKVALEGSAFNCVMLIAASVACAALARNNRGES